MLSFIKKVRIFLPLILIASLWFFPIFTEAEPYFRNCSAEARDLIVKNHNEVNRAIQKAIKELDGHVQGEFYSSAIVRHLGLPIESATSELVLKNLNSLLMGMSQQRYVCDTRSHFLCWRNSVVAYALKKTKEVHFCPNFQNTDLLKVNIEDPSFDERKFNQMFLIIHELSHLWVDKVNYFPEVYCSDKRYKKLTVEESLRNADTYGFLILDAGTELLARCPY